MSFAAVLILAQSVAWADHVPLVLKLAVAAIAVLAAWRPAEALLAVAGLVPFGHVLVTSVWQAYPFAAGEAFVLAFLAGYLWRERRVMTEPAVPTDNLALPSGLFALVVLASSVVQFTVLQTWHDYPLRYASSFFHFLATEYLTAGPDPRPWVDGRGFVTTAMAFLEGIALLGCTSSLCAQQPSLARRLTNVVILAGVGVAMLSFYAPVAAALEGNLSLFRVIAKSRWSSPAIPSIDTAGTYFALVAFAAIGMAASARVYLLPGVLAAALTIGALGLVRTRSAIVASFAIVAAGLVFQGVRRLRGLSATRSYLAAALISVALSVGVVVYNPLHILPAGGGESLRFRALFAETGLRIMGSAPLTGVGVGQYEQQYPEFASRELRRYYPVNNAHNYLLWIGAELGLVGLGAFLWLLVTALARAWSRLCKGKDGYWFLGVCAGLAAFMITWSIGQPMAISQVSGTFWILLGSAAARLTADPRLAVGTRRPLLARIALAAMILFVVGSVPIRASRAVAAIDMSRVSYGFYGSGVTEDGRSFRWAGPRATFFMRSSARSIDLPLAATLPAAPQGAEVDVFVDGHAADHVTLSDHSWRTVRINAPATDRPFWRVDLRVTRIGTPGATPDDDHQIAVSGITIVRQE